MMMTIMSVGGVITWAEMSKCLVVAGVGGWRFGEKEL